MLKQILEPRKIISIRGRKIDITKILPLVETPQFQKLAYKSQLGVAGAIFRSAQHKRFEHVLGVFELTKHRNEIWKKYCGISEQEAWDMAIFASLHDIGHGPYSHVIEALCKINHNQHGLQIIDNLKGQIEQVGASFGRIKNMFQEENPLYLGVKHHLLGTDKLDYLSRDAAYCEIGQPVGLEQIIDYTYFIDKQIVIDGKILHETLMLQNWYAYMYDRVYLRKSSLILQRLMQKMVAELFKEGLTEDELWQMVDGDLDTRLKSSQNPVIKNLWQRFMTRSQHRVAISIKLQPFRYEEGISGKHLNVFGVSRKTMKNLSDLKNHKKLEEVEQKIAEIAQLPAESILLVPVVTPERFIPKDINVLIGNSKIESLKKLRPRHYRSLKEKAESYSTIRVATFEENREKLASPKLARRIRDTIIEFANK